MRISTAQPIFTERHGRVVSNIFQDLRDSRTEMLSILHVMFSFEQKMNTFRRMAFMKIIKTRERDTIIFTREEYLLQFSGWCIEKDRFLQNQ